MTVPGKRCRQLSWPHAQPGELVLVSRAQARAPAGLVASGPATPQDPLCGAVVGRASSKCLGQLMAGGPTHVCLAL